MPRPFRFGLTCPFCGATDEPIDLNLQDLDTVVCRSCDHEAGLDAYVTRARLTALAWEKVARWVDQAGKAESGRDSPGPGGRGPAARPRSPRARAAGP